MTDIETRDLRSESRAHNQRFRNAASTYRLPTRYILRPSDLGRTDQYVRGHNVTSKPTRYHWTFRAFHTGRMFKTQDAVLETREASHAMPATLERTSSQTILEDSADAGVLYSFDKQRSSPNADGRELALDSLVDKAAEKWESGKTDRMLKEYEVLDRKGQKMRMTAKKGKEREGSSQEEPEGGGVEDEDFEMV